MTEPPDHSIPLRVFPEFDPAQVLRRWRLGPHAAALDGPMVTLWEEGTTEPDPEGRRRDDRLIGALPRADAEAAVEARDLWIGLTGWPRRYATGIPEEPAPGRTD